MQLCVHYKVEYWPEDYQIWILASAGSLFQIKVGGSILLESLQGKKASLSGNKNIITEMLFSVNSISIIQSKIVFNCDDHTIFEYNALYSLLIKDI